MWISSLVDYFLRCTKVSNFMTSFLSISDLTSSLSNGILHRKSFPTLLSCKVLPVCSTDFSFSGFKFRSLINLKQIAMQGDQYGSYFIVLHVYIQFFQHQLLKILCFCFFVSHQMAVVASTYVEVLSIILYF